jgi:hypothetical protein
MRVSTDNDRQVMDLQRDALLVAGVDGRHLYEDCASGSRSDRSGLAAALAFLKPGDWRSPEKHSSPRHATRSGAAVSIRNPPAPKWHSSATT